MSEVEATLNRINGHKGVLATMIINSEGEPMRTTADASTTQKYAELLPNLAGMARSLVRDLDPQNDLQFLRIRTKLHEIMVYADKDFSLIVVQDPSQETAQQQKQQQQQQHQHQQQQ